MKKIISITLAIMVAFSFVPGLTGNAYAAVKKPAKVKFAKCTSTKSSVTLKWKKAKNTKKYEVYQLKTKEYKKIKTTKSTKLTIKKLKANTIYRFKIRGVSGKKKGKFSTVKKIRTKKSPKKNIEQKIEKKDINNETVAPGLSYLSFNKKTINISEGKTERVALSYKPYNAKTTNIKYISNNKTAADVKMVSVGDGKILITIHGNKPGKARITARFGDISDYFVVEVIKIAKPTVNSSVNNSENQKPAIPTTSPSTPVNKPNDYNYVTPQNNQKTENTTDVQSALPIQNKNNYDNKPAITNDKEIISTEQNSKQNIKVEEKQNMQNSEVKTEYIIPKSDTNPDITSDTNADSFENENGENPSKDNQNTVNFDTSSDENVNNNEENSNNQSNDNQNTQQSEEATVEYSDNSESSVNPDISPNINIDNYEDNKNDQSEDNQNTQHSEETVVEYSDNSEGNINFDTDTEPNADKDENISNNNNQNDLDIQDPLETPTNEIEWAPEQGFEMFTNDYTRDLSAAFGFGCDEYVIRSIKYSKDIDKNSSDLDKIRGVAEWMADNMDYDWGDTNEPRTARCGGYSSYFEYLMNTYFEIETISVIAYPQSANHAWNLVKYNGNWYAVDVTWFDDTPYFNNKNKYAFQWFMKSSKYFSDSHQNTPNAHGYGPLDEISAYCEIHNFDRNLFTVATATDMDDYDWAEYGNTERAIIYFTGESTTQG